MYHSAYNEQLDLKCITGHLKNVSSVYRLTQKVKLSANSDLFKLVYRVLAIKVRNALMLFFYRTIKL